MGESFVADVARKMGDVATAGSDLGSDVAQVGFPARADDDVRAFARKETRTCRANARGRAGDDNGLVGKGHGKAPWLMDLLCRA